MNRKTFLASLAGLLALPSFLKAKEKNVFNIEILKARKEYLDKLQPLKDPLMADGTMLIMDGYIILYSKSGVARVGDVIGTDKTDPLYVADVSHGWSPVYSSPIKDVDCYKYRLRTTHAPKLICGRPVIKIGGRYRLYQQSVDAVLVQFKPVMSCFREG